MTVRRIGAAAVAAAAVTMSMSIVATSPTDAAPGPTGTPRLSGDAPPLASATSAAPRPATGTPRLSGDAPPLALVEQSFVVAPGGELALDYELHGDLAAVVDDLPPDTDDTDTDDTGRDEPDDTDTDDTDDTGEPDDTDTDDTGDTDTDTDDTDEPDDTGDPEPTAERAPVPDEGVWVVVTSFEPIERRERVARVAAGATGRAVDGARFPLAEVLVSDGTDPAAPPRLALRVPTATSGEVARELVLPLPGLYPLSVEIRQDGRRIARHVTFAERLTAEGRRPARSEPFSLAVVATVPDPGPEPDDVDLVAARSRLVEIAQLGEVLDGPITVAIPPVVARELTGDDDLGRRAREALEGSEILATPAVPFDPDSAVDAGVTDAFTRRLREGEDLLTAQFPSTSVRRSAWLWDGPLGDDGARLLRDLGVRMLVTPLDDYFALEGSLPPDFLDPSLLYEVVLPDTGGATTGAIMSVAVVDPISELLDPERNGSRTTTEVAVEAFATLVATRIQLPDRPRAAIVATDDIAVPDADVLATLEDYVAEHPDFRLQTLSSIPGSTDTMFVNGEPRRLELPAGEGPDLTGRVARIELTHELIDSHASMLPPDDPRPDAWHAELDLLLSTWYGDAEVNGRIDDVIHEVERIPTVIDPPDPFTFTLTGSTSEITVRFVNDGDVPLRVLLSPSASKLTFPEGATEHVLQPGTTTVTIPVAALSNGTFPVTIEILTPVDQRTAVEPVVLTARVNALTGLGQVLTGGAVLVLASWWYSHLRGNRRRAGARSRRNHPTARTTAR